MSEVECNNTYNKFPKSSNNQEHNYSNWCISVIAPSYNLCSTMSQQGRWKRIFHLDLE